MRLKVFPLARRKPKRIHVAHPKRRIRGIPVRNQVDTQPVKIGRALLKIRRVALKDMRRVRAAFNQCPRPGPDGRSNAQIAAHRNRLPRHYLGMAVRQRPQEVRVRRLDFDTQHIVRGRVHRLYYLQQRRIRRALLPLPRVAKRNVVRHKPTPVHRRYVLPQRILAQLELKRGRINHSPFGTQLALHREAWQRDISAALVAHQPAVRNARPPSRQRRRHILMHILVAYILPAHEVKRPAVSRGVRRICRRRGQRRCGDSRLGSGQRRRGWRNGGPRRRRRHRRARRRHGQ